MGALQDWSVVDVIDLTMTMEAVVALVVDLAFLDSTKDAVDGEAMLSPVSLGVPRAKEYPSGRMASPKNDASYAGRQPSTFHVPVHALAHVLSFLFLLFLASPVRVVLFRVAPFPSFLVPLSPVAPFLFVPVPSVPAVPFPSPSLLVLPWHVLLPSSYAVPRPFSSAHGGFELPCPYRVSSLRTDWVHTGETSTGDVQRQRLLLPRLNGDWLPLASGNGDPGRWPDRDMPRPQG